MFAPDSVLAGSYNYSTVVLSILIAMVSPPTISGCVPTKWLVSGGSKDIRPGVVAFPD